MNPASDDPGNQTAASDLPSESNPAQPQAAAVIKPPRLTRRHLAHGTLFATLGVLLVAIVPGFSKAMQTSAPSQRPSLVLNLPLPDLPTAQYTQQHDNWQTVSVAKGKTLSTVFADMGIGKNDAAAILAHPGVKQSLRKLMPGTELAFDIPLAAPGQPVVLRRFRYDRDAEHRVELALAADGTITETVIERPVTRRTVVLSGIVGRSLFHSARKVGLPSRAIQTLTDEIFKYDIDFDSDVGANDRFSVLVEQSWREGELIDTGPVLAATFTAGGKLHSGFRFLRNGKPEYFTGNGRPLKKSFIRMPVSYARLSSNYGMRRHPVLGTVRAHRGVDYVAPTGTPIMAAGDARVEFVGWKGGYGRTVILNHGQGYTTLYGHMSGFGNIRAGQRIAQGTVIGRVGSSGLSTGPHLHYEFRVNGVHRNPLSVTMPPPQPLSGQALAQFRQQTGAALARIREVEDVIYSDEEQRRVATVAPARPAQQRPRG